MAIPAPHGGRLIDRTVRAPRLARSVQEAQELPALPIGDEKVKDLENIAMGAFSPLEGFMTEDDLASVVHERRLASGLPWTIPIVLDVDAAEAKGLAGDVALTNAGEVIATIRVEQTYPFDKNGMAERVFGTVDANHPGVAKVFAMKDRLVGGKIELLAWAEDPFADARRPPAEIRAAIEQKNLKTVVGFQTRNVPHIGHEYLQKIALTVHDGLFINPVIGKKKAGDFQDEVILATYRVLLENYYRRERVIFGTLETEMRYAGPVEAIFHAIVRKNFGCSHIIIGRDHAGVGSYYGPYAAREIFSEFPDLGISPLPFDELFYCKRCYGIASERVCPHGPDDQVRFSGTKVREIFKGGQRPPAEFMRPEVSDTVLSFERPFIE
ncbi:MAG: sulfate adenylyltransferase [Nitrososphaerales archaeon]|jgi:sulfate adenylyltransferase